MKQLNLFFILLLSIISVNSVSFQSDITVQSEFRSADLSLLETFFVEGSTNFNQTFNNISWTNDFKMDVDKLGSTLFISYPNSQGNTSLEIFITTFPQGQPSVRTTYIIEFIEGDGQYYFKINPDYSGENLRIEINAPDTFNNDIKFGIVKDKFIAESGDITNIFIGAMKDLVEINIGFWKILYYLFIFGIILGTIGILVGFGFKTYEWAEDLSAKKRKIFHGGKSDSKDGD